MTELLLKKEVYAVMGAAMEVHSEFGPGFSEAVYHEALEFELEERTIPFESEKSIRIYYKGQLLKKEYFADLVCYGELLVELKTLDALTSKEEAQLLNYLKASQISVGLLINFGSKGKLEWKRFIYRSTKTHEDSRRTATDAFLMKSNHYQRHVNMCLIEALFLWFLVSLRVLRG